MFKPAQVRPAVTLALVVLFGAYSPSPARGETDALPDPIGYVELEGIGRFDVHPAPEGSTATEAKRPVLSDGDRPTAFWASRDDRGGNVVIFALAAPDQPGKGSVWVDFVLNDDRSGFNQDFSRGITYFEPYEGVDFGEGWQQGLWEAVTVEELSLDDRGRMTLRLAFDGKGSRGNLHLQKNSGEVSLRGTVVVEGLPRAGS